MQYFTLTIERVAIFLVYIAIGILLKKTGKVGKNASSVFATFLIYVSTPAYSILNLSQNITMDRIVIYAYDLLWGTVVLFLTIPLSLFLAKRFGKGDRIKENMYKYVFAFSNLGFFGNPLVENVFGGQVLAEYMIFSLPMSIALSTYGFIILTEREDNILSKEQKRKHIIKTLTMPSIIGLFIGIILGLLGVKIPTIITKVLKPASDCYSALPMIMFGFALGSFDLKGLLLYKRGYITGLITNIIVPALASIIAIVAYLFGTDKMIVLLIVLMTALPSGMNVVTYPETVGLSGEEGARTTFISYIMAVITIPVIILLTTNILGMGV